MEIEKYSPPRRSKLFEHKDLIGEMRSKNWPLKKIAEKLKSEFDLEISIPSLHAWCKRNAIDKGERYYTTEELEDYFRSITKPKRTTKSVKPKTEIIETSEQEVAENKNEEIDWDSLFAEEEKQAAASKNPFRKINKKPVL